MEKPKHMSINENMTSAELNPAHLIQPKTVILNLECVIFKQIRNQVYTN